MSRLGTGGKVRSCIRLRDVENGEDCIDGRFPSRELYTLSGLEGPMKRSVCSLEAA